MLIMSENIELNADVCASTKVPTLMHHVDNPPVLPHFTNKPIHEAGWFHCLGDSKPSRLQLFQGTCQTCHHPCRAFFKARGVEAFFSALGPRSPSGFFSHVFPQKLRQQFPIVELGLPRRSKANPLRGEPWEACSHQRKKSAVLSGLHPQWNAVLRSAAGVAGESMTAFQ